MNLQFKFTISNIGIRNNMNCYTILILIFYISLAICQKVCPKYSSYKECMGCPLKCSTMYLDLYCPMICKPGCVCDNGYVLNNDRKCIPVNMCPAEEIKCPNNLVYMCNGCRNTCKHKKKTDKHCRPGCACPFNTYYYSERNACVEKEYCPNSQENQKCRQLDPNSEYVACICTKTCVIQMAICERPCKSGCLCLDGFVWHKDKCVRIEDCPKMLE